LIEGGATVGHLNTAAEPAPFERLPSLPGAMHVQHVYLALEGPEVIELKQVVMDRDAEGAADFFMRVIVPRVRAAAQQFGLVVDWEEAGADHGRVSG
jgi:hypothetical protein